MSLYVETYDADSLDELIRLVLQTPKTDERNLLYFRGENQDFGESALTPSIYRNEDLLKREHEFYREMQRFNDQEFLTDKTAFDKLARMQHYECPTRMIDISEDVLSATYFALDKRKDNTDSVLYVLEIKKDKIKYYDSDAVSVVANLAKSPLDDKNDHQKSKAALWRDGRDYLNDRLGYRCREIESKSFLLHDIKEEKPYFEDKNDPKHLFSLFCVKPKYTNQRIHGQKGAFLLFGFNKDDYKQSINILKKSGTGLQIELDPDLHPIAKITKIRVSKNIKQSDLEKLGISKPYIYPELDKVSEYLSKKNSS
ncbi:MAG: FRG domain-containing protein [Methylomicrobium sp.]|nr:FRG domain-containing protein [Methylomicrobium sp.]